MDFLGVLGIDKGGKTLKQRLGPPEAASVGAQHTGISLGPEKGGGTEAFALGSKFKEEWVKTDFMFRKSMRVAMWERIVGVQPGGRGPSLRSQ